MDSPYSLLKSKLGKRIVLLFLVCALVPIRALGAMSFMQVKSQLNTQTERWLHQETKSRGMENLERLSLLKAEILSLRRTILDIGEERLNLDLIAVGHIPGNHFRGVRLLRESESTPFMTQAQMEHLAAGKVAIMTRLAGDNESRAYLVVALDPSNPDAGLIWGQRNLKPLQLLKEGTRKIGNRRFDTRVTLSSRDEFEELADAFNNMAKRLEGQFQALTAMAEIDRTALSSPKQAWVVDTVLSQIRDRFLMDVVALTVCRENGAGSNTYMAGRGVLPNRPAEVKGPIPRELLDSGAPETMRISRQDGQLPVYLSDYTAKEVERFLVLPIRLNGQTAALLSLGSTNGHLWDEETVSLSRQIADQVGIALSNASLLEELQQLNWDTLKALARTVDAKPTWTAGHSERVGDLAMKIGQEMRLETGDLANIHRAGLLHDIGKIGVPSSILDKPGKLSEAEYERVKKHPTLGAKILEPISAYAEVVDLVRQHHERFDGCGYPDGLSGSQIALGARILAVADTFDAVTTDRPYRKGLEAGLSVEMIRVERSRSFDPEVVHAFLSLLEREGNIPMDILRLNSSRIEMVDGERPWVGNRACF